MLNEEDLTTIGKTILKQSISELKLMLDDIAWHQQANLVRTEDVQPDQLWFHTDIFEVWEHEKRLVEKEIKNKTFKLRRLNGETIPDGRLTDEEVVIAKAVPIQTYYAGTLRKSGGRFTGLCPFHVEKSGSFFIYKDNSWWCFGCSQGGDAIEFVMKLHSIDFRQAVKNMTN